MAMQPKRHKKADEAEIRKFKHPGRGKFDNSPADESMPGKAYMAEARKINADHAKSVLKKK